MPNTILFSESLEGLSLRKGDFYLGTNDVGKGPTSLTGFYNGYPVGTYSYVIYLRKLDNIFPRSGTTLAFTSAYNGTNYGFGAGTNLQQEFQDDLRPESTTRVTKVSRINSNVSQRDYVYVGLSSPLNSTRIVSFWYYGTYGSQIQVYNNDGSANLSYLNSSKNWVAGSTSGFRYVNIPVTINVWQKIVVRIVNNGTAGTGLEWIILHNDVATPTLANTEYWAFSDFIYEEKPLTGPAIYPIQNDTELIERTNQIDTSVVRTTKEECFSYFAGQSDKMIVNRDYESIVTDGLVLNLDAGFLPSYPATGSSWLDLSVNGNNGTLENGPTFGTDGGGSIVFDGSNDFVNVPIGSQFNTPSVTFDCWVNLQNRNNRHIVYVNWTGNALEVNSNRTVVMYNFSSGGQLGATTTTTINFGEWANITGLYNATNQTLETYINGVLRASRTSTPNTSYSVYVHKISGTDFGGVILGNVSIVRHYNRALSASEILQNYNATKGRFGL